MDDLISKMMTFFSARGYEPGERIPSERELAERFNVSRGQIRESLSFLDALRVIERRPKSGIFMSKTEPSLEALAYFAQTGVPLTFEEVHQTVEMRMIHEIAAIRMACERRTDEDLNEMRDILEREADDVEADINIAQHDRQFHASIIKSTKNNVFFRIVNIFYIMTEQQRVHYFRDNKRARDSHGEHLELFDAIAKRESARAMELMNAHLRGVDSYWLKLIEKTDKQLT
jgi:GntR family transcriptional repressor for pyruvate dehydrogenase complex